MARSVPLLATSATDSLERGELPASDLLAALSGGRGGTLEMLVAALDLNWSMHHR